MSGPAYHGRTHLPGGTDPIPGLVGTGGSFQTSYEFAVNHPNILSFYPLDEDAGSGGPSGPPTTVADVVNGWDLDVYYAQPGSPYGTAYYPQFGLSGPFTGLPAQTAMEQAGHSIAAADDDNRVEGATGYPGWGSFETISSFTIEFWLLQLGYVDGGQLLNMGGISGDWGNPNVIGFQMTAAGFLSFWRAGIELGGATVPAAEIPLDSTWRHVRATYNATDIKLFVDFLEIDSQASGSNVTTIAPPLTLGNANGGGSIGGVFRMAHVAIYTGAITTFPDLAPDGGSGAAEAGKVLTAAGGGAEPSYEWPTIEVTY